MHSDKRIYNNGDEYLYPLFSYLKKQLQFCQSIKDF